MSDLLFNLRVRSLGFESIILGKLPYVNAVFVVKSKLIFGDEIKISEQTSRQNASIWKQCRLRVTANKRHPNEKKITSFVLQIQNK